MATPIPMIGPTIKIVPGCDGQMFRLGDPDPGHFETGGFSVDFDPSPDFVGAFEFKGRNAVKDASDNDASWLGPWPFRVFYLNGTPEDGAIISGTSAIVTTFSSIVVPAHGKQIAMMVSCSAGSCQVYVQPVVGTTAL